MSDEIKINGKKEAAEILAALDEPSRERILAGIAKSDPVLAETLRKGMFTFAHVLRLAPLGFQRLMREVPSTVLAMAIRGLDPASDFLLFSKIPERQGRALREEREAIGPRKQSDVNAAREKILDFARRLHAEGEINLLETSGKDDGSGA